MNTPFAPRPTDQGAERQRRPEAGDCSQPPAAAATPTANSGCSACHGSTGSRGTCTDATMHRRAFVRRLGGTLGLAAGGGILASTAGLIAPVEAAGKAIQVPLDPIGLWLGNVRALTPSQALQYTDPATGDPALLLRLADGRYVSYDAVCPHAGCTVAYDPRRRLIICPCHDAIFDPTRSGSPISGPARQPLYPMAIRVDAGGNVFALDGRPGSHINRLRPAPPYSGQTGDDGGGNQGEGDD